MKKNKFFKKNRSLSPKFYWSCFTPDTQGYWSYHHSNVDFIRLEPIWVYIWFMSVSGENTNCKSVSGNTSWWRSWNRFSASGSMNNSYSSSGSFH